MFHLAYLGLMFGGQSEEEASLEIQVGIMYQLTPKHRKHIDQFSPSNKGGLERLCNRT